MNIEQEFRQFIEFGHVFDKATRRELVQYLKSKLYEGEAAGGGGSWQGQSEAGGGQSNLPTATATADFLWADALDRVFLKETLLRVTVGNESLATQIIHDTLQWMRRSQHDINRDNPVQEEFRRLQS